jgi:hypothetical protein
LTAHRFSCGLFNTEPDENGEILMYPQGDRSVPPSAKCPMALFDSIVRQPPIDDARLNVEDNSGIWSIPGGFDPSGEAENPTPDDKAIVMVLGGMAYGDIALVPGPTLKAPKGIRDMTEWYMSTVTRQDYVRQVFERQCEIALENLPDYRFLAADREIIAKIITDKDTFRLF